MTDTASGDSEGFRRNATLAVPGVVPFAVLGTTVDHFIGE
jgi:hypothetical protein